MGRAPISNQQEIKTCRIQSDLTVDPYVFESILDTEFDEISSLDHEASVALGIIRFKELVVTLIANLLASLVLWVPSSLTSE